MPQFIIHGARPLKGEVSVSGSKNAALPILAATLLTDEECVIRNVPDIEDIHTLLAMLRELGSRAEFKKNTVTIQTKEIKPKGLSSELGCKMRASVLLLGPLLARTGYARLPYPGGCVLGARPIDTHAAILAQLGIRQKEGKDDEIIFEGTPKPGEIILPEFSVTATENALMAASRSPTESTIRLAASEPHVQDLCRFLECLGVKISGIGTHTLIVNGVKNPHGAMYAVTPDYLEAGTLLLAALATRGTVTIRNVMIHDLDVMWNLLREMHAPITLGKDFVEIKSANGLLACKRLQTNVFPGFPTDLQPPFAVLMTQAEGSSRIHETLFEGRFNYFPELAKMGASIEKHNPHEAVVHGPRRLSGTTVKSWDIRAGAAMIVAALAAEGRSTVTDIHYIDRGYEKFDEKLRSLGADIQRVD